MPRFEEMYGNFVMLGLIVLALFSLIIIVQSNNDATQPLIEGRFKGELLFNSTYVNLTEKLDSLENTSSSKYSLFSKEGPKRGFGSIVLFSIVNLGKTFANMMFILFTLVIKVPLIVLGIDSTITSMIISFLTISVIIALWIVYKFGG